MGFGKSKSTSKTVSNASETANKQSQETSMALNNQLKTVEKLGFSSPDTNTVFDPTTNSYKVTRAPQYQGLINALLGQEAGLTNNIGYDSPEVKSIVDALNFNTDIESNKALNKMTQATVGNREAGSSFDAARQAAMAQGIIQEKNKNQLSGLQQAIQNRAANIQSIQGLLDSLKPQFDPNQYMAPYAGVSNQAMQLGSNTGVSTQQGTSNSTSTTTGTQNKSLIDSLTQVMDSSAKLVGSVTGSKATS